MDHGKHKTEIYFYFVLEPQYLHMSEPANHTIAKKKFSTTWDVMVNLSLSQRTDEVIFVSIRINNKHSNSQALLVDHYNCHNQLAKLIASHKHRRV